MGNGSVESSTDKVMNYFKNHIVSGEWKSGHRLPTEAELCEQIGVSRSCIREAFKVLASSHIIDIRRGDGTYICESEEVTFIGPMLFKVLLSKNSVSELYEFREITEMMVLHLAILHADDRDLSDLEQCNLAMHRYIEEQHADADELYELDMRFHETLGRSIHNSIMKDIYVFAFELFSPLIRRNYRKGQNAESALVTHEAIYKAIKNHDIIRAGYAVRSAVELWKEWNEKTDARRVMVREFLNDNQKVLM